MSEFEYKIGQGGRIKAAGVPMDTLFDPLGDFTTSPTSALAAKITIAFARLRHSPPDEVRDRFFPRDSGHKSQRRSFAT